MASTRASSSESDRAQISRVPYLPGLDGMRALAVIAVMVFHANHDWLPAGFLGVEVFFVISGYLITLLLIAEHERSGAVSLRAFWGRRFRRLLPALYLTLVAVTAYCALFLRDPLGKLRGDVVAALFYVSNWYQIWTGQGYSALSDFVPLRHLWSLAVEEQFYLIWPIVMIALLRAGHRRLPQIGLWLIGISVAITIATALLFHGDFYTSGASDFPDAFVEIFGRNIDTNNFLYLGTISRSSGILLGAGFAMLWRPLAVRRGTARDVGRTLDLFAVVGLVGLAALMLVYELTGATSGKYYAPLFRGGFFLTGVFTLFLIAAVTHGGSAIGKLLGWKVLNYVGTRSYGLYLFHWPIYQIIRKQAGLALTVPKFVLAIACTLVVTEASYRFLEMPVRRRELFGRLRNAQPRLLVGLAVVGALTGYAAVQLAAADVTCSNKIECASQEAEQGNTLPTVTVAPIDPTVSAVPQPTAVPGESTTIPTTTQPVKQAFPVIALGESVMAGALGVMSDNGIQVDAAENRQGNAALAELQQTLQTYDVTEALVIQIGTNGPVSSEVYDQMMTAAAGVPRVVVMTVKAPLDWIAGNNALIRALPTKFPNVVLADWEQTAATIPDELSKADGGIHLNSGTALRVYTNLILGALGKPLIPDP